MERGQGILYRRRWEEVNRREEVAERAGIEEGERGGGREEKHLEETLSMEPLPLWHISWQGAFAANRQLKSFSIFNWALQCHFISIRCRLQG